MAQLTLRTFNGHQVAIDLYLNAGWNRDGETSNTSHSSLPFSSNRLPDVGENFAAHTLLRSLLISEQARGGGQNSGTETTQNPR